MIVHVTSTKGQTEEEYIEQSRQRFLFETNLPDVPFAKFVSVKDFAHFVENTAANVVRFASSNKRFHVLVLDGGNAFVHPRQFIRGMKGVFQQFLFNELLTAEGKQDERNSSSVAVAFSASKRSGSVHEDEDVLAK